MISRDLMVKLWTIVWIIELVNAWLLSANGKTSGEIC